MDRRNLLLSAIDDLPEGLASGQCLLNPLDSVNYFLEHDTLAPAFAKYVYDVFQLFPLTVTE